LFETGKFVFAADVLQMIVFHNKANRDDQHR
jgi:hypothetical protein